MKYFFFVEQANIYIFTCGVMYIYSWYDVQIFFLKGCVVVVVEVCCVLDVACGKEKKDFYEMGLSSTLGVVAVGVPLGRLAAVPSGLVAPAAAWFAVASRKASSKLCTDPEREPPILVCNILKNIFIRKNIYICQL